MKPRRLSPSVRRSASGFALCSTLFALGFMNGDGNRAWASAVTKDPALSKPGAEVLSVSQPNPFSVDERLRKNVDFWVRIYSQYDTRQGVIHDAKYVDHVYEVLDLQGRASSSGAIREAKRRWRDVLISLHKKTTQGKFDFTDDEKRVFELYRDVNNPNKFLEAANRKRLRFQLGQKDRFLEGLKSSGQYLPAMEEVFRSEGLPVELTRLPFVESSFNLKARSKVGASGIWQFMRSTGKLFLRIDSLVDERNDPIRAAEAAARLLKMNYESLGKWPLAVTAYNHGRKGIMRAVLRVGSDQLEDIVESYRGNAFGFASSNFFACLLAAIEVEKNAQRYFGNVERDKPLEMVEATLPESVSLKELSKFLDLDASALKRLNPGLSDEVLGGKRMAPAGYQLRLPRNVTLTKEAQVSVFMSGFNQIPAIYRRKTRVKSPMLKSRVKYGTGYPQSRQQ